MTDTLKNIVAAGFSGVVTATLFAFAFLPADPTLLA
jgi:hypothetical protein